MSANGAESSKESWTVLRMILWSADYLADKGVSSSRLDAEHLLAHVVGVGRLQRAEVSMMFSCVTCDVAID